MVASWNNNGSNGLDCTWLTPEGDIWKIENGLVVDGQGVVVGGVQPLNGGEEKALCGLNILVCSEVTQYLGHWHIFPGASGEVAGGDQIRGQQKAFPLTGD